MASLQHWIPVTPQDKRFYQTLGQRIAVVRRAQGLTQQQLAERLNLSQQTITHYEVGRLRVAVAALARKLAVPVEGLIGNRAPALNGKRGPTPKLQRQLEQIKQLPRAKQRFVIEMLETVLQQRG